MLSDSSAVYFGKRYDERFGEGFTASIARGIDWKAMV